MNCLEFRRAIGSDPRALDEPALAHRGECPRCAEAHERALVFERTLTAAIAIPVPEGLAERILLRQTTAAIHEPRPPRVARWLVAAGVLLAIGIAATVATRGFFANATLGDLAIAHLVHEPFALSSRAEVPADEVVAMFAALDVPVRRSPGPVHYLNDCPLDGRKSLHMVLQRDSGPVTAMYVPKRHEATQDFAGAGMHGRERTIGDGTLILLATDTREFDAIEAQFQRAFSGGDGSAVGAP